MAQGNNGIYIAWVPFQRRAESISRLLGLRLFYVPRISNRGYLLPFSYIVQSVRTLHILWRNRSSKNVWVQVPPTFLVHLLVLVRPLLRGTRFVLDFHNSAFRGVWSKLPGTFWLAARLGRIVVHNREIMRDLGAFGVSPGNAYVITDPPAHLQAVEMRFGVIPPASVVVPCSFAEDEPIDAIMGAAQLSPEITWFITGSRTKARAKGFITNAPGNVVFTDYLSLDSYNDLFCRVGGVIGLTTMEGIQLSVGNEAIGAGKALLLSSTTILRAMFADAALFTSNDAQQLAMNARRLLEEKAALEAKSFLLSRRREQVWMTEAKAAGVM